MMDDQSFELLISKLSSIEQSIARIEATANKQTDELWKAHMESDKRLQDVEKEVTFAKGVTYAINAMSAAAAWLFGWSKQ